MTEMLKKEFSRKSFVKGGGAMIVGFSLAGAGLGRQGVRGGADPVRRRTARPTNQASTRGSRSTPTTPCVVQDGRRSSSVRASPTGLLMIAAEELDMDVEPDERTATRTRS